jgi:glutathione reductase (NADPH)
MADKGVRFRPETELAKIERKGDALVATTTKGEVIDTDCVMYATGRVPNTAGLGLEKVGVTLNKAGAVAVDEWSASTVGNIYAVGDLTDRINLTPVALMEGHCFADTVFGKKPRKPDHQDVPSAVFSQPQMATVGLTEEQARRVYPRLDVYASSFTPMKHTLTGRKQKTFMKLLVDAESDRVVGAHMVGDDAAELIQGVGIAVKARATKAMFDATVGIHPTAGEEFVTMRTKRPDPKPAAKAAE